MRRRPRLLCDRYVIRTRNLQDWNLTRYRCANRSSKMVKAAVAVRRVGERDVLGLEDGLGARLDALERARHGERELHLRVVDLSLIHI